MSDEFSADLLHAVRDFLDVCEYGPEDLSRGVSPQWWLELQAKYPPGPDGSGGIAAAVALARNSDSGCGSDKNRMAPNRTWREEDKTRMFRQRGPRRRPTEAQTLPDGSPLRVLDLYEMLLTGPEQDDEYGADWVQDDANSIHVEEVISQDDDDDDDGDVADADRNGDDDDEDLITEVADYDDDGAEVEVGADYLFDGVHGHLLVTQQDESDRAQHHLLELCLLCGDQIPVVWKPRNCEFLRGLPEYWAFLRDCRCNGCLRGPKRTQGKQRRYCSDECRDRVDNAMDRAYRRAEGKRSRSFDPPADRIAEYKLSMKAAARQSKSASGYQSVMPPNESPTTDVVEPERSVLSVPYLHRDARSRLIVSGGGPKRLPLVFRPAAARQESDSWRHVLLDDTPPNEANPYHAQVFPSLASARVRAKTTALVGNWSELDREMFCGEVQLSNRYESPNSN